MTGSLPGEGTGHFVAHFIFMLPLQITLEGFMSYRETTTLSFEGAPLWMLAGANGAGKSSVFDAMRWTLFGAHRGGKSGHEALVHRQKERLRVAFDLALEEKRFRLIRTLARAGRSTWQIEEILGDETVKIPETDGRDGYEKWVRENIGIGDETFCTAMYLAQNRGDAILGATPLQRYEMLGEIVDISAYAALHERAKTRAADLEIAARAAENAWKMAPETSAAEIETLGENLAQLNAQIAQNAARRDEILRLEPLAAHWQELESARTGAQISLETARENLRDAAQIEADFARLIELETLLPPLEKYAAIRQRAAQNARETQNLRAPLQNAREALSRVELDLQSAQQARDRLESAQNAREMTRLDALWHLGELAPQLAGARQIALYEGDIAALQGEIAAFPADLSAQISALESDIERAQNQQVAAEILRRFAREKTLFRTAIESQKSAQSQISRLETELPDAQNAERTASQSLEIARENHTLAVQTLAASTTRRGDCEAARARFDEVRGESNCYFCGQTLTPQHAAREENRLEIALQNARRDESRAQNALETQDLALKAAKNASENAQNALRNLESELEEKRAKASSAQVSGDQSRVNAAAALGELNADFVALFAADEAGAGLTRPDSPAFLSQALSGDFPTPEALETLQNGARKLESLRVLQRDVSEQEQARREIATRLSDRQNQLAPLRAASTNAALGELQKRESALKTALQDAISALENGAARLEKARETMRALEKSGADLRAKIVGWERQLAGLEAASTEIARALKAFDQPILAAFAALGEPELFAGLERLQSENSRLENGDLRERAAALREAQTKIADVEREVLGLENALQSVPTMARRAPKLLQDEAQILQNQLERGEETRRGVQLEKSELERQREAKKRLESAHLEVQNRARQHKTLADLLGPHQLQRFLLREAENGIIDEANTTLDRISGGQLRLELRADDEEIAGARKGIPKVLDVAIFRADEGENGRGPGMLPAFLSGSQRFRVAVALALGIGRYATRGGGTRLEAVIIDEGFGALDRIGRGEMIDELQMLGEELPCVILVSHQEEFFEAFPNRYLIENNGETSTARLMVS